MVARIRTIARWLTLIVAVGTFAVGLPGTARAEDGESVTAVSQSQPGFYVRASCDHDSRLYYEGDPLSIKLKCETDAFIYAVYQQADGQKYQIFPNSGQPNNRVKAGEEVVIPGKDDSFRWTVTAPFGKEQILVVASKEPIKILTEAAPGQRKFTAISNGTMKGAALELDQQAAKSWTEHLIEITTAPRPATPAPAAGGRRFGLFVGIGQYVCPAGKPLRFAVSDATLMGHTFQEIGGVPEENMMLLADRSATKQIIEYYITEKLPASTRPGDTVFIYFSGHGSQIPDEPEGQLGHDEIDGLDELLCTYDMMDFDTLFATLTQVKNGKLKPEDPVAETARRAINQRDVKAHVSTFLQLQDDLEKLKDRRDDDPAKREVLKKLNGVVNEADLAIIRETGITDDEFGHWLQKLDGRQVVIILDACQSGGFSKNAPKAPRRKDLNFQPANFLDSTMGRLKDIGQRDVALFAAAPAELASVESGDTWGGVMTHFLADAMKRATGSCTLQQAYDQVKPAMADWFERNRARLEKQGLKPHEPQLFNDCRQMPVLRP